MHILVVHYVLIPKWQEKLDGKKQKSVFFAAESTQNDQNRVSEDWNELAEEAGRMTSQIAQNVCLFGFCQVFERGNLHFPC